MPPSARATLIPGNLRTTGLKIHSTMAPAIISGGPHDIVTNIGDSSDIVNRLLDDPMCMQTTVSVSSQAAMRGSQCPPGSWMVGRPSMAGFSENATAVEPFSAVPPHLGRRQRRVPQWDQRQRDVPAGSPTTPFVDHPVVVGLHAQQGQLSVLGFVEHLTAEAGEGREAQRGQHAGPVHVLQAGHRVVAARAASRRR